MKVVGITGGVGAGKSQIMSYLEKNTRSIIVQADDLAKQLCRKGFPCYEPLIELLGKDTLDTDGEINKSLMASKIFNNNELLMQVNQIIHPEVKKTILTGIEFINKLAIYDFFFIEAALLIEDGYKEIVDEIWYIYASEDIRRARLKTSRGYSDAKVDSIFASQLSDEEFRNNSDFVIDNSGDLNDSISQIEERIHG